MPSCGADEELVQLLLLVVERDRHLVYKGVVVLRTLVPATPCVSPGLPVALGLLEGCVLVGLGGQVLRIPHLLGSFICNLKRLPIRVIERDNNSVIEI